ncbi:MAG: ABC transporter ATP-binding protein [Methanoregula sp.]
MITIRDLRCGLLDIGSLDIEPGITSIIGPNGSGKTTLLKLLAGITIPESGEILVDDRSPRNVETGWVNEFPDRNILFDTVADEVASPLRFRRIPCNETSRRVTSHLEFMHVTHLSTRSIRELSGGEKILVAIAAAAIHHPDLLVLDECDSHLNESRAQETDQLLKETGARYIIRCTQQMESAARSDRLIYLEQGRVIHNGSPPEVFSSLASSAFYPLSWRCGL